MNNEEQKKVETPTPPASEEKKSTDVPPKTGTEDTGNIDYKAELEETKKKLSQAEYKLHLNSEKKKAPKADDGEGPINVMDPDEISEIAREAAREESEKIHATNRVAMITDKIRSKSSNADEEELITYHLKNSIRPTGNIDDDIDNAKLLANRKKHLSELSEAKRAVISKENRGNGSGAGQKISSDEPITLTPQEEKLAKRYGLTTEEAIAAKAKDNE